MFRGLHKDTGEKIYAYDFIKDHDAEYLRLLSNQHLITCEECKEPIIFRCGEIKMSHFSHYPLTHNSPECTLRIYSFKKLFSLQLPPEYQESPKQKHIPPVFRRRYFHLFNEPDQEFYDREYGNIEAIKAKDRGRAEEFQESRKIPERSEILTHKDLGIPFEVRDRYGIPIYCICERCGELKKNWYMINYDNLQGRCKDCFY